MVDIIWFFDKFLRGKIGQEFEDFYERLKFSKEKRKMFHLNDYFPQKYLKLLLLNLDTLHSHKNMNLKNKQKLLILFFSIYRPLHGSMCEAPNSNLQLDL